MMRSWFLEIAEVITAIAVLFFGVLMFCAWLVGIGAAHVVEQIGRWRERRP